MILRVGLTGGIASGKSTIARILAQLGCYTIDADQLVSVLYRPGKAGHTALLETYGPSILREDGEVDRIRLANTAFSTRSESEKLNHLIHPLVLGAAEAIVEEESERRPGDLIAVIEATLLVEAGGRERYDRLVVVDVPPSLQIARGVARGMTREEVVRRMRYQITREERLAAADYVIDNSGKPEDAELATRAVYARLQADLAAKR